MLKTRFIAIPSGWRTEKGYLRRKKLVKAAKTLRRKLYLERARRKGRHSAAEWRSLISEFQHRCVCCGATEVRLIKDHIVPLVMGGSDGITNLQPLCEHCHSYKEADTFNHVKFRRRNSWRVVRGVSTKGFSAKVKLQILERLRLEREYSRKYYRK